MKSDKMPQVIYDDIEFLIRKIDGCASNPEKSSTTKIGENIPCGYSMSKIWRFYHIENKHTLYHGKDHIKKFCDSLREHAKKYIIDFEKKNMLSLIKEESELYQYAEKCYIFRRKILEKFTKKIKVIQKLEIIVIIQVYIEVQCIVFVI